MTPNVEGRVVGIGTDICDIRRIQASLDKFGDKFAKRVLGDAELQVWQHRTRRWPDRGVRYLATRFSAKEAFSKAIGLGIHEPMQWRRCEILNRASGEPYVQLHGPLHDWCSAQGWQAHITLSDETDYAVSFCVIQKVN